MVSMDPYSDYTPKKKTPTIFKNVLTKKLGFCENKILKFETKT